MSEHGESSPVRRSTQFRAVTISYWFFTLIASSEMIMGGLWDFLQIGAVRVTFKHLRYPLYLLPFLGIGKLISAVAILAPRFPRVKERAYAGALLEYSGALISPVAVGDCPQTLILPLALAIVTLAS